jgi:hypothetical protein
MYLGQIFRRAEGITLNFINLAGFIKRAANFGFESRLCVCDGLTWRSVWPEGCVGLYIPAPKAQVTLDGESGNALGCMVTRWPETGGSPLKVKILTAASTLALVLPERSFPAWRTSLAAWLTN